MYWALKQVHLIAVGLSFALFVLRGGLMLVDSPRSAQRWLSVLPHMVDTVLLSAGVALAFVLHQIPGVSMWLTAKLIALLIYIVLGSVALKRGRSKSLRAGAFVAALSAFFYIVGVALHKNPWSWFSP